MKNKYIVLLVLSLSSTQALADGQKFLLKFKLDFNGSNVADLDTSDDSGREKIQEHMVRGNKCLAGITKFREELKDQDSDSKSDDKIIISLDEKITKLQQQQQIQPQQNNFQRRSYGQQQGNNFARQQQQQQQVSVQTYSSGAIKISVESGDSDEKLIGSRMVISPSESDCKTAVSEIYKQYLKGAAVASEKKKEKSKDLMKAWAQ